MYEGIKSCISINNAHSELISCNIGVRQGGNLTPVLFSNCLNDLEVYILSHNCNGVSSVIDANYLLCLIYADDTNNLSNYSTSLTTYSLICSTILVLHGN